MDKRIIDQDITLVPYFLNEEVTLQWYQDPDVCRQVDDIDHVYSLEDLQRMYGYLNTHGDLFYIQYKGTLVGDVALRTNGEVCIVVSKPYQNRHIGRRCIENMLALAREGGMSEVRANIYSFNRQSRRMFEAIGFRQTAEEWYCYDLDELKRSLEDIHSKAKKVFENEVIPKPLRDEFNVRSVQYRNMYSSIETMKDLSTDAEAIQNLSDQQNNILKTWLAWEQGIIKQALGGS